jgi:dephospho-CoA kinase
VKPEEGRHPLKIDPAFVALGVTGGIASGKSTVVRMFVERGAVAIDADAIAREVMAPGQPVLDRIRRRFGDALIGPDGALDRAALAARIFASLEERRALNEITHPAIVAEIECRLAREREIANRTARPGVPRRVVVAEIPLLIEEGLTHLVDQIVLVVAKQSTQVARLMSGKGLTEEQAWARIRAQLPPEQKIPYAHWVIDGELSLPATERRVDEVWRAVTSSSMERGDGPRA